MTDIMTQLRDWSADKDQGRTDFDDLAPATYTRRVPKNMVRIVEGATDLRPTVPTINRPSGMTDYANPKIETRPVMTSDGRTPRQVELMLSLIAQLDVLDHDTSEKAAEYTARMTEHNAWTPGREGNASVWIGNMITKVRELKANRPVIVTPASDDYADIPKGYYAVGDAGPDDIKFYRVTKWNGRTYVKVQASDELHPIHNEATRRAILVTIRTVGVAEAMAAYGQLIGACGRCHRTLTDATSRSLGIGPECRKKM
jgi:uncharacterized protein DUF6011